MASAENTKLCDFTSTNNNDFICTPIAPPTSTVESYEIKPALWNLVMKEQFSRIGEDVASHLNPFLISSHLLFTLQKSSLIHR